MMQIKKIKIALAMLLLLPLTVKGQTLSDYLGIALAQNPALKQYALKYGIATEKINEAEALPNTTFSVGGFVKAAETRTGAQRYKLSFRQMFPWFGTIKARKNYARTLSDAQREVLQVEQRKVVRSVSDLYYQLYALQAKIRVVQHEIEVLHAYEKLATRGVEAAKNGVVDVLRLQLRQNELEERKEVLRQNFIAQQAQFNALLDIEAQTPVVVPDSLTLTPYAHRALMTKIDKHPELLRYDALYQSAVQKERLNQKERAPQFGVGLDYVNITPRPDMNFSDNGKDILMPMVSLSIPIFTRKYSSRKKQYRLEQQALVAARKSRYNALNALLQQTLAQLDATQFSYATQVKNEQQAQDAERILVRKYETARVDFEALLEVLDLQLSFQLKQVDAVSQYFRQCVVLDYLTEEGS